MGPSKDGSRDEVRKIEFPQQADSRVQVRFFAGDQSSKVPARSGLSDERGRCLRPRHKFRNTPRSLKDAMIGPARSVNFRKYRTTDFDPVAALWTRINENWRRRGWKNYSNDTSQRRSMVSWSGFLRIFRGKAQSLLGRRRPQQDCRFVRNRKLQRQRHRASSNVPRQGLPRLRHCATHARLRPGTARQLGFAKMVVSTAQIQKAADKFSERMDSV